MQGPAFVGPPRGPPSGIVPKIALTMAIPVLGSTAAGSWLGAQLVYRSYQVLTSGLFWGAFNVYRERGDLASLMRGEGQTVGVSVSARPAKFPFDLYRPLLYPQPYIDLDVRPRGNGAGSITVVPSSSRGSGAPAESPTRTDPPPRGRRKAGRPPRYCHKHRRYDWC